MPPKTILVCNKDVTPLACDNNTLKRNANIAIKIIEVTGINSRITKAIRNRST